MNDQRDKSKRRGKRRKVSEAELGFFLGQYGRRAYPGQDPNDRAYDRGIEEKIKRMTPEELDRLMRGDDQTEDNVSDNL